MVLWEGQSWAIRGLGTSRGFGTSGRPWASQVDGQGRGSCVRDRGDGFGSIYKNRCQERGCLPCVELEFHCFDSNGMDMPAVCVQGRFQQQRTGWRSGAVCRPSCIFHPWTLSASPTCSRNSRHIPGDPLFSWRSPESAGLHRRIYTVQGQRPHCRAWDSEMEQRGRGFATGFAPQSTQIVVSANQWLKKTRPCGDRKLTKNSSQSCISACHGQLRRTQHRSERLRERCGTGGCPRTESGLQTLPGPQFSPYFIVEFIYWYVFYVVFWL